MVICCIVIVNTVGTVTSLVPTTVCYRDKLAQIKLTRYKDDLLFYMFYTNAGDVLQLAAAAELWVVFNV